MKTSPVGLPTPEVALGFQNPTPLYRNQRPLFQASHSTLLNKNPTQICQLEVENEYLKLEVQKLKMALCA